jgi:hypothetical protein
MKPCSCTLVHKKMLPPTGAIQLPYANPSGFIPQIGGSYTHRKRILAEASNTKVQYKGSIANSLPLNPAINCNSNFSSIVYTNNPNCNCLFL